MTTIPLWQFDLLTEAERKAIGPITIDLTQAEPGEQSRLAGGVAQAGHINHDYTKVGSNFEYEAGE